MIIFNIIKILMTFQTIHVVVQKQNATKIYQNIFHTITYHPNIADNHKMKHHKGNKN